MNTTIRNMAPHVTQYQIRLAVTTSGRGDTTEAMPQFTKGQTKTGRTSKYQ